MNYDFYDNESLLSLDDNNLQLVIYHYIPRCVRRAFLFVEDNVSGLIPADAG